MYAHSLFKYIWSSHTALTSRMMTLILALLVLVFRCANRTRGRRSGAAPGFGGIFTIQQCPVPSSSTTDFLILLLFQPGFLPTAVRRMVLSWNLWTQANASGDCVPGRDWGIRDACDKEAPNGHISSWKNKRGWAVCCLWGQGLRVPLQRAHLRGLQRWVLSACFHLSKILLCWLLQLLGPGLHAQKWPNL